MSEGTVRVAGADPQLLVLRAANTKLLPSGIETREQERRRWK